MQATTPVAPGAEPGTLTVELKALDLRAMKLVRFAHVKRELRDLRAEYNQLEEELFGEGWQP